MLDTSRFPVERERFEREVEAWGKGYKAFIEGQSRDHYNAGYNGVETYTWYDGWDSAQGDQISGCLLRKSKINAKVRSILFGRTPAPTFSA